MKFFNCLIFFYLIISCSNNDKRNKSSQSDLDYLSFYVKKAKDESISADKRIEFNNRIFLRLKNLDNTKENREELRNVAELYYKLSDLQKLKQSSFLLLANSRKAKDTSSIGKSYNLLGRFNLESGYNDSAFYYFIKAEKIFYKLKDNKSLSINFMNKANVQINENDFSGSEQSSFLALAFMDKKDVKSSYNLYNFIGSTSDELGNYENSIIYYKKALELSKDKELEKYNLTSSCYNNLGFVYQNLDNHKMAINYFKKGLEEKQLMNYNPSLYSKLIDNYAYSKFKIKDYNELPNLFYKALKIRTENQLNSGIIINKIHLSEYYTFLKDSVKSKKYSYEALNLAKTTKVSSDILASLKQLSNVDNKNSAIYSKEYIKLSDSIQKAERKVKDRFARIQFETDEIIQQNTQLSEQNRDILNYFAIAIVFGGFLFFARFQRLKARELALKQTQQQANEEIYRLIISHQNQLEEGRDLEKKRISKELHDGVLGRLFGLRLNLDGLNNFDDEETKQQRLEYLNELKVIEQDLREISHELSRENLVLINNFVAIINNLLEQQSKINSAKINTLISDKIDWEKVSNTIKINLYRILQESLQNINKHAEATKINVIFNKDPKGNLIFSVEDNGKGYNTNGKKTKGIGMNNIVERVHQCQGKIDIKSQIGKGTKIIITFPLENETINI